MGKITGKCFKYVFTGKKDHKVEDSKNGSNHQNISGYNNGNEHIYQTTPISNPQPTTPKEKRRWSFCRPSAATPGRQDLSCVENNFATTPLMMMGHHMENDTKKHALPAVAAVAGAAAVVQLTAVASGRSCEVEEGAAVIIQSFFRGYLARKALNALKGLVKLQALVRGHLVRKQAIATLRCMQTLVTVQTRARSQRLQMIEETNSVGQRQFIHRKSANENIIRNLNQEFDRSVEENIKTLEIDYGDNYKPVTTSRNSYSNSTHIITTEQYRNPTSINQENSQISPSQSSIITDMTPQTHGTHFEEYVDSIYNEYPFYPSYMANTESSRAKARSHSAPKQRPVETFERQMSKRRPSLEGRNVPRAVRMQRSSSHVGSTAQINYHNPWSVKLDRSAVSLVGSECGSTSTVLTNTKLQIIKNETMS